MYQTIGRAIMDNNTRKVTKIDPVKELKTKLSNTVFLLKNEQIHQEEYYYLLYLLVGHWQQEISMHGVSNYFQIQRQLKNDQLKEIAAIFDPISEKINFITLVEINDVFAKIDRYVLKERMVEIFEDLFVKISELVQKSDKQLMFKEGFYTFFYALVNIENAKIYNPFVGNHPFPLYLSGSLDFFGQEVNSIQRGIALLRHFIRSTQEFDTKYPFRIENSDALWNWNPHNEKFDVIAALPPIGNILPMRLEGQFGAIKSFEHYILERSINLVKSNSKLVLMVSNKFLSSNNSSDIKLKERLIELDLIEKIISIPEILINKKGLQLSILVLNGKKDTKGKIQFVNANEYIEISNSDSHHRSLFRLLELLQAIRKNEITKGISILPNNEVYFNDLNVFKYLRTIIKTAENETLVKISDLVRVVKGSNSDSIVEGKTVTFRDLKNSKLDYQLELENLEETKLLTQTIQINETCILVSLIGNSLRPTLFIYDGKPIYITENTLALKINETLVVSGYLINELYESYFIEQIESIRFGATIPFIDKNDFLNITVKLPSLNEQQLRLKYLSKIQEESIEKQSANESQVKLLESELIEQNTYLRHKLAGPSSNVKYHIAQVRSILNNTLNNYSEILHTKLSAKHEYTLGDYLEFIERDAKKIHDAVSSQLKVSNEIESKQLSKIDILSFMHHYVSQQKDKSQNHYEINFEYLHEDAFERQNRANVYINGNIELLIEMLDNMIENAIKHAFEGKGRDKIQIYLIGGITFEEGPGISLLISNSGKPIPSNITINEFVRKGFTSKQEDGNGYGGWYINEIVKQMNGRMSLIDETVHGRAPEKDMVTSFEIEFPIFE